MVLFSWLICWRILIFWQVIGFDFLPFPKWEDNSKQLEVKFSQFFWKARHFNIDFLIFTLKNDVSFTVMLASSNFLYKFQLFLITWPYWNIKKIMLNTFVKTSLAKKCYFYSKVGESKESSKFSIDSSKLPFDLGVFTSGDIISLSFPGDLRPLWYKSSSSSFLDY